MRMIITLIFISIFVVPLKSQSIEIGKNIQFDDCSCIHARAIKYDTIKINNKQIDLKITCLIETKELSYKAYSIENEIYRNGNFFSYSLLDTSYFINAFYLNNRLTGFSLNYGNTTEVYDVKNRQLHGSYLEYKNNFLVKEGYFTQGIKDSLWVSYYSNREIKSEGSYNNKKIRIDLDRSTNDIYVINNDSDTIDIKPFSNYQSIINEYNYQDKGVIRFPIIIEQKKGVWKYFDQEGKLIREEKYDD